MSQHETFLWEAVRIAKENANGMKVKDHIKVGASSKSDMNH